jgi:hypothetical protein
MKRFDQLKDERSLKSDTIPVNGEIKGRISCFDVIKNSRSNQIQKKNKISRINSLDKASRISVRVVTFRERKYFRAAPAGVLATEGQISRSPHSLLIPDAVHLIERLPE